MSENNYPQIDLAAWTQVGEGGNGRTYVNPAEPDVILKVNDGHSNDLASVKKEFDVSKAVEGLGLPTPKMYRIVRVGNGYAATSELIPDKKSLSRICQGSRQSSPSKKQNSSAGGTGRKSWHTCRPFPKAPAARTAISSRGTSLCPGINAIG